MSKVTIPEPEAFLYVNGEHRGVSLNLCGGMDLSDGTVRYALITTDQAESYANARVREALSGLPYALRDLVAIWRKQQGEYPAEGKQAAAAVRLCANELELLLARYGQPLEKKNDYRNNA